MKSKGLVNAKVHAVHGAYFIALANGRVISV